MQSINDFIVLNIRDYLNNGTEKPLDQNVLHQLFDEFSCPLNPDVERFLKERSIDFVRKHQAVTYLVLSSEEAELLGYFSITVKPLVVKATPFSNTVRRKLMRFSEIDNNDQMYNIAAYLIAQLGKNYNSSVTGRITGQELLEIAIRQIQMLQYQVGGMVLFVETDHKEKLLAFYEDYGFKRFDTRQTITTDGTSHNLVQLLKLIQ